MASAVGVSQKGLFFKCSCRISWLFPGGAKTESRKCENSDVEYVRTAGTVLETIRN